MKAIVEILKDQPLTAEGAARIADIQSRGFDHPNEDPALLAQIKAVKPGELFTLFNKTYIRRNTARAGDKILFSRAGERLYADERNGNILVDGRMVTRPFVGLYVDRLVVGKTAAPRSYRRANGEVEGVAFGEVEYDAILGVLV